MFVVDNTIFYLNPLLILFKVDASSRDSLLSLTESHYYYYLNIYCLSYLLVFDSLTGN